MGFNMKNNLLLFLIGITFAAPTWAGKIYGPGNVTISAWGQGIRDKPIGKGWVIHKGDGTLEYEDIDCPITLTATVEGGELVPGYTNTYKSGIPSVGLRFGITVNPGDHTNNYLYKNPPFTEQLNISGTGSFTLGRGVSTYALTGHAEAGIIDPPSVPRAKYTYSGTCIEPFTRYINLTVNTEFKPVTCSVANKNVLVNLGSVPREKFKNVGDTSPEQGFNITINCDTEYNFSAGIYVTFTDDSNNGSGNNSNILPLDAQSTAKGVGVQILYKDQPVSYGPDSSMAGNEHQILLEKLNTLPVSSHTYNFKARYISTGPVSGGTANSRATFTMSYQ